MANRLLKELIRYNINILKSLIFKSVKVETNAIFYHHPHGQESNGISLSTKVEFHNLAQKILANPDNVKYSFPNNIAVITYNNQKTLSTLEKCYNAHHVSPYFTLAKDYTNWDWLGKIKPVLEFLLSDAASDYEYVLATDASDVLLVNDPTEIIHRFKTYNTDILFCNTVADWPPNENYNTFELSKYHQTPFHAHLSAGGYFGKKESIKNCLSEIITAYEQKESWVFHNGQFDDQLSWRFLHKKYYPKIKVDNKSLIFQRFDNFRTL